MHMPPVEHNDPINAKILAISEDKIEGFAREPFQEIARRSGVDADVVMERIAGMLRAGTIRRVRQTLLATNLAEGALVAWKVPPERIDSAFDWMFRNDPFSGHVVLRSTDTVTAGSDYKLWTTVQSTSRIFITRTLPPLGGEGWRRSLPNHARKRYFHTWSRTCAPKNDRGRKQRLRAGQDDPGSGSEPD